MFTCAFNGPRDDYHLPLALHEQGLLSRLVTDTFAPDWLPLPGALRRRRGPLPMSRVETIPSILAGNLVHRLGIGDAAQRFARNDARLSHAALATALRTGSHLYLYSRYAAEAFRDPRAEALRKGLFVFHPFEPFSRKVLEADIAASPEAGSGALMEPEFTDTGRYASLEDEWRLADFITCASSFTRRSLVESGCPADRIRVIPYGIDAARIPFDPRLKDGGPTRFLFVGQGVQRKGFHHLLKAWELAGLGNAELTCVCYRADPYLTANLPLGVTLLTKLSRAALDHAFGRAHVFVLPSLIEGFGLVLLEAFAHGCHVISTPNTGLPDIQAPAGCAQVVPTGDPKALAAVLQHAAILHAGGLLDAGASRDVALSRPWSVFRSEIGAHALQQLHG